LGYFGFKKNVTKKCTKVSILTKKKKKKKNKNKKQTNNQESKTKQTKKTVECSAGSLCHSK
jgi:hypothetical protein